MIGNSEGSEGTIPGSEFTLLLSTCVILGKLLNLSELPKSFPTAKEYTQWCLQL